MVIAIPTPLVVQGYEEQVGVFEILEGCLPGSRGIEQNGITQRAAQAVEDRCAQQERLDAFGLLPEDFFHQIVQHEMVAAGERSDEAGGVLHVPAVKVAANCRPAIQPSVRLSSAAMSSAERIRPITWLRNSAASEGVKRKSAARSSVKWPPARNRAKGELWILTGGDDQVHLWWQVLDAER